MKFLSIKVAAILQHLRLLTQQYFDIADYVGSLAIDRGVAEAYRVQLLSS
jgi:hypothetical protein